MSMANALIYPGGDAHGTISGPSQSPVGAPSMGSVAGGMGTALGLGLGATGLGMIGRGIGTAFDVSNQNDQLSQMGIPSRPVSFFSAFNPFGEDTQSQALSAIDNDPATQEQARAEAQMGLDPFGGPGGGGGASGQGAGGDDGPGGDDTSDDNSGSSWYNGGYVPRDALVGSNPPGPDEGHIPIQAGEFVLPRAAVKALGPQRLRMLQAMTS